MPLFNHKTSHICEHNNKRGYIYVHHNNVKLFEIGETIDLQMCFNDRNMKNHIILLEALDRKNKKVYTFNLIPDAQKIMRGSCW